VSHVVERIFELFISGKSTTEIAKILTEEKIKSPAKYLNIPLYRNNIDQWIAKTIVRIIRNQVYIGNMVGLKTKKINYKLNKYIHNKEEDCVIVKNTHQPIISKKIFEEANKISAKNQIIRKRKHDDILKGFMYCQECGSVMTLKVGQKNQHSFLCSKANISRGNVYMACDNFKTISSPKVYEKITEILKNEFTKIKLSEEDIKKSIKNIQKTIDTDNERIENKIENMKNKIIELNEEIDSLYKDKVKNIISVDDFSRIYDNIKNEKITLQKRINEFEKEMENGYKEPCFDLKEIKKLFTQFLKCKEPSKELLYKLIDKIEMDKSQNLTVKFNFH